MRVTKSETAAILGLIARMAPLGPSYQEIADELGVKSKATVHQKLVALRRRRIVTWIPARARSLRMMQYAYFIAAKNEDGDTVLVPMGLAHGQT